MPAQFAAIAPTIFEKLGKKFEKAEERIAGSLNKASNLGPSIAPPLTLSGISPNSQNIVNAGFSTQAADVSQGIIQKLGIETLIKELIQPSKEEIKDTPLIKNDTNIKKTPAIEKPAAINTSVSTKPTPTIKTPAAIKTTTAPIKAAPDIKTDTQAVKNTPAIPEAEKIVSSKTPVKQETKKTDTSPTQQTNTPVREATKSREEGRTKFEQLFLDLVNGKLNIKF